MNRREAIAALVSLPPTVKVSRAQVKASDVIVIECDEVMNVEMASRIHEDVQKVWPDNKIAVFAKGMRVRIAEHV